MVEVLEGLISSLSFFEGPAFVVDKMAWILISRFNEQYDLDNKLPKTYKEYTLEMDPTGKRLSLESWETASEDASDYYPDTFVSLGYKPYEYKNIEIINGCFMHLQEFIDLFPEDIQRSKRMSDLIALYNLTEWDNTYGGELYIDYSIEVIDGVKRTEEVDSVLRRLESSGEYNDYYGDGDVIGFYIEDSSKLYHVNLFGNYGEETFVCDENRRPSYFLELLLLDTLIEQQKGGSDV